MALENSPSQDCAFETRLMPRLGDFVQFYLGTSATSPCASAILNVADLQTALFLTLKFCLEMRFGTRKGAKSSLFRKDQLKKVMPARCPDH